MTLDEDGMDYDEEDEEARLRNSGYAKKIQPLRAQGNLLLCTLLLGNVAVNVVIPLAMASIPGSSGVIGGILSTIFIVIVGEIVPQAMCSREALYYGSQSVSLVWIILYALFIITYPIAKTLDYVLGDEVGTVSLYLSNYLSIYLSIHPSTHLSIYLSLSRSLTHPFRSSPRMRCSR